MIILIVSATAFEIEPTVSKLGNGKSVGGKVTRYNCGKDIIDILITGVGMVATVYWLTRTVANQKYDHLINAGVCGSFNRSFELGTVVNIVEDSFPEIGAESSDSFLSVFDLNLLVQDEFPFSNGKLLNNSTLYHEFLNELPPVSSVTVNTVHGNDESILRFKGRIQTDIESMEGAAFFYVCRQEGLQFIQIRAISNYVESRDPSQWDLPLAIRNLNEVLIKILQ
jgi:futalosine hydrolase